MDKNSTTGAAAWLSLAHGLQDWPDAGERLDAMWSQDRALLDLKARSVGHPFASGKTGDFDQLLDPFHAS